MGLLGSETHTKRNILTFFLVFARSRVIPSSNLSSPYKDPRCEGSASDGSSLGSSHLRLHHHVVFFLLLHFVILLLLLFIILFLFLLLLIIFLVECFLISMANAKEVGVNCRDGGSKEQIPNNVLFFGLLDVSEVSCSGVDVLVLVEEVVVNDVPYGQ